MSLPKKKIEPLIFHCAVFIDLIFINAVNLNVKKLNWFDATLANLGHLCLSPELYSCHFTFVTVLRYWKCFSIHACSHFSVRLQQSDNWLVWRTDMFVGDTLQSEYLNNNWTCKIFIFMWKASWFSAFTLKTIFLCLIPELLVS